MVAGGAEDDGKYNDKESFVRTRRTRGVIIMKRDNLRPGTIDSNDLSWIQSIWVDDGMSDI